MMSVIYVATNGNDTNSGTDPSLPLLTIQKALDQGVSNGISIIRVQSGTYTPGRGLNGSLQGIKIGMNSLNLTGGWDNTYSSSPGTSVLNGQLVLNNVIYAENVSSLFLSGFTVCGGYAVNAAGTFPEQAGAGLYLSNVSGGFISAVVSNNTAYLGGGICLLGNNNIIAGYISGNHAVTGGSYGFGGGIFAMGNSNSVSADIVSNDAADSGGGVFFTEATNGMISGENYMNTAGTNGGGIYLSDSSYIVVGGAVYGCSARGGGGLAIYRGDNIVVGNTISNNTALNMGGGISIDAAQNSTLSGDVFGNSALNRGGGISMNGVTNCFILGRIGRNQAQSGGGGINMQAGFMNMINAEIFSNSLTSPYGTNGESGGGIFMESCFSNDIGGLIYGNSAYWGGGIELYRCGANAVGGAMFYNKSFTNILNGGGDGAALRGRAGQARVRSVRQVLRGRRARSVDGGHHRAVAAVDRGAGRDRPDARGGRGGDSRGCVIRHHPKRPSPAAGPASAFRIVMPINRPITRSSSPRCHAFD